MGVGGQGLVQDGVRYLIGDFIGMAFCHGFGGEQEFTLAGTDRHGAAAPLLAVVGNS
jgi:hypothetical protein